MEKQKFHLEYVLNTTSRDILWQAIGSPAGLENWFADKVKFSNKEAIFYWGKTESRVAHIVSVRPFASIRFRWEGDEECEFFEIRMDFDELVETYTLVITDFAFEDEVDDAKDLWNAEVTDLRRAYSF